MMYSSAFQYISSQAAKENLLILSHFSHFFGFSIKVLSCILFLLHPEGTSQ